MLVRLGVRTDQEALDKFNVGMGSAKKLMLAAAGAAVVLAGALTAMTLATAKQGDEAAKMGAQIGATAEEVQELTFAVEQSGASQADLKTALRTQARTAAEAAEGTGAAADAYRRLGVNAADATGKQKPQVALLQELATKFKGLTNDGEAAALAQDVFGRAGTTLLPFLRQGAEGIEAMRQEARDLGFVLSAESTVAAEELTDSLNRVSKITVGLRNQIGAKLLPVATQLTEAIVDWFKANRDVIGQRIDRAIESIVRGIEFMLASWREVNRFVEDEIGGWGEIFDAIGIAIATLATSAGIIALITILSSIGPIMTGIGAAVGAISWPFVLAAGLIIAAVGLILLALEDFKVFMEGGDSVIGRFFDQFGRADEVRAGFKRLYDSAVKFGTALSDVLTPAADGLGKSIKSVLGPAFLFLDVMVQGLIDRINAFFIVALEKGLSVAADTFDLLTLALTDFDAASAAVFNAVEARATKMFRGLQSAADSVGLGGLLGAVAAPHATVFNKAQAAFGSATVTAEQQAVADRALGSALPSSQTFNMGDTNNISGGDPQAVLEALEQRDRERLQKAMAAARGGTR